jgi:hypothetical protein
MKSEITNIVTTDKKASEQVPPRATFLRDVSALLFVLSCAGLWLNYREYHTGQGFIALFVGVPMAMIWLVLTIFSIARFVTFIIHRKDLIQIQPLVFNLLTALVANLVCYGRPYIFFSR